MIQNQRFILSVAMLMALVAALLVFISYPKEVAPVMTPVITNTAPVEEIVETNNVVTNSAKVDGVINKTGSVSVTGTVRAEFGK
ncbi:MAG: hypothetical protein WCW03_00745 [Candidatus Paceibacterota bacterium]